MTANQAGIWPCYLKKRYTKEGGYMLKEYKVSEINNIKVHGRTTKNRNPLTLFWTASGVEFNSKACEVRLKYTADYDQFEPWIDVIINGVRYQKRPLEKGTHEITIWRSNENRNGVEVPVRNIKILRDTPAMPGDAKTLVQIESILSDGTFEKVAEPKMRLEFIGDSITSGEGCMGPLQEQDWNSSCFDCVDHYAYITAKRLSADYQVFSQSGWGISWSWYGNHNENMPAHYGKICSLLPDGKFREYGAFDDNDFESFKADAIIVNLGTNDVGAFSVEGHDSAAAMNFENKHVLTSEGLIPEEDEAFLKGAVVDFLATLREKNPDAKLIWAYGMLAAGSRELTLQMSSILENAVKTYSEETGDKNVFYLSLPETQDDGFGSRSHPGLKSHENAAVTISEFLRN